MEKQWVGSGSEGLVCLRVDSELGCAGEQEKRGEERNEARSRMKNEE